MKRKKTEIWSGWFHKPDSPCETPHVALKSKYLGGRSNCQLTGATEKIYHITPPRLGNLVGRWQRKIYITNHVLVDLIKLIQYSKNHWCQLQCSCYQGNMFNGKSPKILTNSCDKAGGGWITTHPPPHPSPRVSKNTGGVGKREEHGEAASTTTTKDGRGDKENIS